ncbi:unnamed protein product [Miscanthus lutarioriparius]|uniref:RING-type E3 ubiquitin transferase n=1 Tax=Miscanthus lutarioriparius TaxID=422564 RepID=A0A811PBB0_9POAL|nr:unnamed protein product [Miscanthus lutarioriparius]
MDLPPLQRPPPHRRVGNGDGAAGQRHRLFPSGGGLDDAAIAGLAVTLYRQRGGGGGTGAGASAADDAAQQQCCSICLGEFQEGDKVKALPRCGHGFHPECVDAWLRARASCPLCRDTLLAAAVATKPDAAVGSEAV